MTTITDAERVARVLLDPTDPPWGEVPPVERDSFLDMARRLIDSGLVTVNSAPDPAEQINDAFWEQRGETSIAGIRRLIADGWIVPGPKCDQ